MTERSDRVPSANNPQLMTRLLELVARGIRTVRGLREVLGIQAQTVRNYAQAARWLDLLDDQDPMKLTALGLAYVYAGPRRAQVYVQAVWSNPFAADLLVAGDGRLPEVAHVERALRGIEPELAAATVRRRASSVRSLIAPAVGRARPPPPGQDQLQLSLPLGHAALAAIEPAAPQATDDDDDPDVYRFVLGHLLDHGELALVHVRALLDRVGCRAVDVGGPVLRAQARGDAVLYEDRLVATAGAVQRRDLASSTASIILSDPQYRAYLRYLIAARDAPSASQASRFVAWDRRLFGRPAEPLSIEADLRSVLLERSLEAFPLARGEAVMPLGAGRPFLNAWEDPGLAVAMPPTLAQLLGGVDAVDRLLDGDDPAAGPTVITGTVAVHGGLVHPLEARPGRLGSPQALRTRALQCSPGVAFVAALLLLHRQGPERFAVVHHRTGWGVQLGVKEPRPLFAFLEAFGASRRWVVVRRPAGGLDAATLLRVAEVLGVATLIGRHAVMAEALAVDLGDGGSVADGLNSLADAVMAWLEDGGASS